MELVNRILEQFKSEYDFLYNNMDCVVGSEEAMEFAEEFIGNKKNMKLVKGLIEASGSYFISDRELTALGFALAECGF